MDERLRGSMKVRDRRTPRDWRPRRPVIMAGAVVALLGLAALIWALWPSADEPRPREYRDVTACLLTGAQGVTASDAAPVWAGMQTASAKTHGQARYLAVTGDQTVANAQTFAGTLVLGRCAVIVAAPGIADEAIRAVAAQHPDQRFLVVGGAAPTTANVSRVDASTGSDVSAGVASEVTERLTAN